MAAVPPSAEFPVPEPAQRVTAPAVRIGDRERDLALTALGDHLAAGRLDAGEFEERSGVVLAARTQSDVDALFADLPAPHPSGPGAGSPPAGGPPRPSGGAAPRPSAPDVGGGATVAALADHAAERARAAQTRVLAAVGGMLPIIALLWGIWAVTGTGFPWPVFPTVGMLLGAVGSGGGFGACGSRRPPRFGHPGPAA